MQAVALTLKLDHYYFKGDEEDSIIHYTKVVKEFAEKPISLNTIISFGTTV